MVAEAMDAVMVNGYNPTTIKSSRVFGQSTSCLELEGGEQLAVGAFRFASSSILEINPPRSVMIFGEIAT